MKSKSALIFLTAILFLMTMFFSCYKDSTVSHSMLHLSPVMCKALLNGVTPQAFCDTRGDKTFLDNKYSHAEVDEDGCLILELKNEVISEWKNTLTDLQILQCVLGDTRDIGITIDYSKDFMGLMERAHTCGYEISEDFTHIVESPEDNSWYYPFIVQACATLQVFEGKSCTEMKIVFVELDSNGEIVETIVFPDAWENSSDITE